VGYWVIISIAPRHENFHVPLETLQCGVPKYIYMFNSNIMELSVIETNEIIVIYGSKLQSALNNVGVFR
jgi:hypothetical protein